MPDIWMDVDTALTEVPVNVLPLIDDGDFKSIEGAVAYNASGMALYWHFVTTAGVYNNGVAVTPTTGGDYDWTDHGASGIYTIEIPASGGASINNDTEGFGWFTGVATGILPWRGPVIGFRAAALNDALIDSAWSTTRGLAGTALPNAAADAAGGLPISDAGGLDLDAKLANTNEVTAARMGALTDWIDGGRLDLILDSCSTLTSGDVSDAVWGVTLSTYIGFAGGTILDILTDTNELQTDWADGGRLDLILDARASQSSVDTIDNFVDTEIADLTTELAKVPKSDGTASWNATALAAIQSEANDAIVAQRLDELLNADSDIDGAAPPTVGSVFHELMSKTAGSFTFDQTTDSCEALRDNLATASALTTAQSDITAILADTNELQTDWVNGGRLDLIVDSILDDTGTAGVVVNTFTTAGKAEIQVEANDALVANNLDHLCLTATAAADMTAEVADNTIISRLLSNGDTSVFDPSTDGLQPIRDRGDAAWVTGSFSTHSAADVWAVATRVLTAGTNIQLPSNGLANVTAWTVDVTGDITGNLSGSVGSVTGGINTGSGVITTLDALDTAQDVEHDATQASLALVAADLPARITKNVALAAFPFKMVDATDHVTAETGITVTATRSIDGAAFGACANAVSELSNGWYTIDLAAGDLNGNTIVLRFTGSGCDTNEIVIVTQNT